MSQDFWQAHIPPNEGLIDQLHIIVVGQLHAHIANIVDTKIYVRKSHSAQCVQKVGKGLILEENVSKNIYIIETNTSVVLFGAGGLCTTRQPSPYPIIIYQNCWVMCMTLCGGLQTQLLIFTHLTQMSSFFSFIESTNFHILKQTTHIYSKETIKHMMSYLISWYTAPSGSKLKLRIKT